MMEKPGTGMKKYQPLFFDLDNTLWDFDKNSRRALFTAYKTWKIGDSGTGFSAFYGSYASNNARMWEKYRNKEISKQELIRKRFELTFLDSNVSHVDPLEFNETYLNDMPEHTILIEGARDLLDYLRSKHYSLHMITNGFKEVQLKKLEKSKLSEYFGKVIVSETLKAPKPDETIFEYALKSTNAKKSHSLMVGDSWEVDIVGAMKAGIDQVHYVRNGGLTFNPEERNLVVQYKTKTFRIDALNQLKEVL
jgi:putative hydrolase of the HAD superfamily